MSKGLPPTFGGTPGSTFRQVSFAPEASTMSTGGFSPGKTRTMPDSSLRAQTRSEKPGGPPLRTLNSESFASDSSYGQVFLFLFKISIFLIKSHILSYHTYLHINIYLL